MKVLHFFILSLFSGSILAGGCMNKKTDQTTDGLDKSSAEWPIFRGDTRLSGVADGELPDNLQRIWTFQTDGEILSSAVIGLGKVFIGSTDQMVYALDFSTGEKIWNFAAGSTIEAAPLLLDQTLFIGTTDGSLLVLDAHKGEKKWQYQTGSKIVGSANWDFSPDAKDWWYPY